MKNSQPKVSVILPAYNAAAFVETAIDSVLNQIYPNVELLIINDGSTDATEKIIEKYLHDPRIVYLKQPNAGVSAARNAGLERMSGAYFCFVDADDALPPESISSRMRLFFENPALEFVDGTVDVTDENLNKTILLKKPFFRGNPRNELIKLNRSVYICPSWLVKILPDKHYRFQSGLTHCEDVLFYLQISEGGGYDYVPDTILLHRRGDHASAIKNLKGLENGYITYFLEVKRLKNVTTRQVLFLKYKIGRMMFLTYLSQKQYKSAVIFLTKFIWK